MKSKSDATAPLWRLFHGLVGYRYTVVRNDPLTALANRHGSDRGNLRFCRHHYTRLYDALFSHRRNQPLVLLEIGLLRTEEDNRRVSVGVEGKSGARGARSPSLEMWRSYFRNARLFGFDVDDFSTVHIERCSIVQGDMSNKADLETLVTQIGQPIDIVIDDGSHVSHHQQIAFGFLFRHVAPGGHYIIEDLHWQDPRFERPDAPKMRQVLRTFQQSGAIVSPFIIEEERRYIETHLDEVTLFDTCEVAGPKAIDALAVLRKSP